MAGCNFLLENHMGTFSFNFIDGRPFIEDVHKNTGKPWSAISREKADQHLKSWLAQTVTGFNANEHFKSLETKVVVDDHGGSLTAARTYIPVIITANASVTNAFALLKHYEGIDLMSRINDCESFNEVKSVCEPRMMIDHP